MERDLDHMPDVALAVRARYWLITNNDSQAQLHAFDRPLRKRLNQWEQALPRVFQTTGRSISIYDLECIEAGAPDGRCEGVKALLSQRDRPKGAVHGGHDRPGSSQ